jgi:N-acetylglucosaminyldiphosphoundecaprenol N-acetyl-beta-D-mannosaminyltransferase
MQQMSSGDRDMRVTRTNTLGIRVDAVAANDASFLLDTYHPLGKPGLFTFVNPASVVAARRDSDYRQQLIEFDAVLPDGIGMCWAVRLLHGLDAPRISFDTTSLAPEVFRRAQQQELTVALVGGRPGIAELGSRHLKRAFPGLPIVATLHGYGDHARTIHELRSRSPSIVICGMGCGPQEKFLLRLADAGWSGTGFTCGGYLDQLAHGLHYYPRWIDAANLRWVYRLIKEPRRLARRYGIDYTLFTLQLARALLSRSSNPHTGSHSVVAETPAKVGAGGVQENPNGDLTGYRAEPRSEAA